VKGELDDEAATVYAKEFEADPAQHAPRSSARHADWRSTRKQSSEKQRGMIDERSKADHASRQGGPVKPAIFMAAMAVALSGAPVGAAAGQGRAPAGSLSNGLIALDYDVPDAQHGRYRGTRFDWSGIIRSLRYRGQEYHGRWFDRIDPEVHDNVRRTRADGKGEVVTGIASSGQGPAEEFLTDGKASGFDDAGPGGLFLKIGVGLLRRPDDKPYDRYRAYEIVDGGTWSTRRSGDSVTFTQTLSNASTGFAYVYTKTLRLLPGRPMLRIEHRLRSTGSRPITASVYDHNFFATTGHHTGPDFEVTTPYPIRGTAPQPELARVEGNRLSILKPLRVDDMIAMPIAGFRPTAEDYAFRVENSRTGTGYQVRGDRPLDRIWLWSIWTNISMESFIKIAAAPQGEERWAYEYTYFANSKR
jgi:hypothetical protein